MTRPKLEDLAGVFDIECADWDRFVCGEILSTDGDRFFSWDEDEYARNLISRVGVWYAHFGGRYDALWLLQWATRKGHTITEIRVRGAGILSCRIGDLEIRDSGALVPMSLEKCAPLGGQEKSKLALDCECGEDCGGYCSLSRRLSAIEKRKVEAYQHQDCVALLAMLKALADRCAAHGIVAGLTIGGSAWATAKAWLDLPNCKHDLGRYQSIRRGYYGGRVEVFRTRAVRGDRYDIHSSYPAALSRLMLPVGAPTFMRDRIASSAFASGRDGVFTCRVYVPECDIPPLPVRMADRLIYPHGTIEGTWTGLSLRHAVECGAHIDKILHGHVWGTSERLLKPFADKIWALREEGMRGDKADRVWGAMCKWISNSCTGKFAQLPDHETLAFIPAIDGAPLLEKNERMVAESDDGVWISRMSRRVDACAHVEWSATLTSFATCELHSQLLHAGDTAIYCDTDSVYSTRSLTRRLGNDLGEWGHEGSLEDWQAAAPKVYAYTDQHGKRCVRGKGLSGLTPEGFAALLQGSSWEHSRGVDGLRTSLGQHSDQVFKRRTLSRTLSPVDGWIGGRRLFANGTTGSVTITQYEAGETARKEARSKAAKRRRERHVH